MAGLYIHIPFCSKFCTYCDFYSTVKVQSTEAYLEALSMEMEIRKKFFIDIGVTLKTVYFGGGTPSLLTSSQIESVMAQIVRLFGDNAEEVTIELNPDDISLTYLEELRQIGINRVSIGVQSFDDQDLIWMGRRHTAIQAIRSIENARRAGFDNISIDLIFGFEGLSQQKWQNNITQAIALRPEHLSCYHLSIEPGTKLDKLFQAGKYNITDDSESYRQYSLLQHLLTKSGYKQYEVSNFSLPNRESQHNSSYWNNVPYLGVGPSAHSFDRNCRFWNISDLNKYISAYKEQCYTKIIKEEILTERDLFNEQIMLSLRQVRGLDHITLKSRFPSIYYLIDKTIQQMLTTGTLIQDLITNNITVPPERLFLTDGIIRELFI